MTNPTHHDKPDQTIGLARATMSLMAACPDDVFLLELISGELDRDKLAAADSHLDQCESCRAVVAELALSESGGGALAAGAQIDRYVISGLVGRGAMGTVYAAFDPQLDRKIAVKLLRGDVSEKRGELLLREARAMAKLSHPNIVAVYDSGRAAGSVYLAMELVEGQTLREWLGERERSWREIRDVFVSAIAGVQAAHEAGIVHRDLKPENILIAASGEVKVADFGVALGVGQTSEASASTNKPIALSRTGVFAGTPAYMSPEQLRGERAIEKSDQFSLCVAFHEALAGARPFEGETVDELSAAVERAAPTSTPGAPRFLSRAIAVGLSADPADRWGDLGQLGRALVRDRERRPRLLLATAAITAAAVSGGAIWALSGSDRPRANSCDGGEQIAATVWNADRAAALKAAIAAAPAGYIRDVGDRVVAALDDWSRRWALNHRQICQTSGADVEPAVVANRMQCLDRRLKEADALIDSLVAKPSAQAAGAVDALASSDVCVALVGNIDPPKPDVAGDVAQVELDLAAANANVALGDFSAALAKATAARDRAIATRHLPTIAAAQIAFARSAARADRLDDAAQAARNALKVALSAGADVLVAEAMVVQAAVAGESGRPEVALHIGETAEAAIARIGGRADLTAELAVARGLASVAVNDLELARELVTAGLEVATTSHRARLLIVLGDIHRRSGDLDAAEKAHRGALAANRERFGANHPSVAGSMHNIAGVLRLKDKLDAALDLYREALAIKIAAHGDNHSDVAITRNSIALIHIAQKQPELARAELEKARAILSASSHPELSAVEKNLELIKPDKRRPNKTRPVEPGGSYAPTKPWQPGR